jgi:hypothetical protein
MRGGAPPAVAPQQQLHPPGSLPPARRSASKSLGRGSVQGGKMWIQDYGGCCPPRRGRSRRLGGGGSGRPLVGAEAAADDRGWGGGGSRRPRVGAEAATDGRGWRHRWTAAGGGRGGGVAMGGVVGLREGERNRDLSQECGSRPAARILQLPLWQLLEAEQWLPLPHFALVGRDGEAAGVGLMRVGGVCKQSRSARRLTPPLAGWVRPAAGLRSRHAQVGPPSANPGENERPKANMKTEIYSISII